MLRLIGHIAQATLLALIVYNSITALWGWPQRAPAGVGNRSRQIRVVIPAHNEAGVIGTVIADLKRSDYPSQLFDIWVIDDRSDDGTGEVATRAGARVARREEGESGKGPALSWFLESHPLGDEDLVVFDADNRVPTETLGRIADEFDNGHQAVQCYLDTTNPDASWIAEASALSYWAGNRMVQLARSNLGWSADLGGTGMGISANALAEAGGFTDSLTEDQDLGIRLLLAGHRVEWLHDVRVRDEKPRSVEVTVRQRARWMAGKRLARRRHLGSLIRSRVRGTTDMAIRLVQPGRSFVALISAVLAIVAMLADWSWLWPWHIWIGLTVMQFLLPIPFLARDGVSARRLLRYPLLAILAILWVPIRVLSARQSAWYHTAHEGLTADRESDPSL